MTDSPQKQAVLDSILARWSVVVADIEFDKIIVEQLQNDYDREKNPYKKWKLYRSHIRFLRKAQHNINLSKRWEKIYNTVKETM